MEGKHSTLRAERKKAWAIIRFMFIALVLTNTANAQQKVGTMPEWVTSYLEAYYTLNFVGAAAAARGGSGVALSQGAMSLAANPAAIFPDGRIDVALEIAGLRNSLEFHLLGPAFPHVARDYSQPAVRPGAVAVSFSLSDRVAMGFAFTNPRSYKMHDNAIFTEATYEFPYGAEDFEVSLFQQLRQWQTSVAVAVKPLHGLEVGIGVDLLSSQTEYSSQIRSTEILDLTSLDETFNSYLLSAGIRHKIAEFAYGVTARTGDRIDAVYANLVGDQPADAEIPWELAIGVVYRDAVSFEVRRVGFRSSLIDALSDTDHLTDFGAGTHVLVWSDKHASTVFFNTGFIYRTLIGFEREADEQVFLNLGAELRLDRIRLAATVINGHLFSDEEVRVSELQLSLGYSVP